MALLLILASLLLLAPPAWAGLTLGPGVGVRPGIALRTAVAQPDVYVAQSAAGADTGVSCATAHAATWFNNVANWGTGPAQIGPGTHVHLCGTIATALIARGDGAAGRPVTIRFEPNAKISLTTCNTICLDLSGRSYLTVDGGVNGIIETTNNGTALATQNLDIGINIVPGHFIDVAHLTIRNMYQYVCCTDGSRGSLGIYAYGAEAVTLHDNTISMVEKCIKVEEGNGVTGVGNAIYRNTLSDCAGSITYGGGDDAATSTGTAIYGNDITAQTLWCTGSSNLFHNDPIQVYTQVAGGSITGLNIYNNYIHGNWAVVGGAANYTGAIFFGPGPSPAVVSATVFNNLIVMTGGHAGDGLLYALGNVTVSAYHNTFDCTNSDGLQTAVEVDVYSGAGAALRLTNNIILSCRQAIRTATGTSLIAAGTDRNDYYNIGAFGWVYLGGSTLTTLAAWQAATGQDANAITANPTLAATYAPLVGSPVIGLGQNLSNLGIGPLNQDKGGIARSGRWDTGCCAYGP